MKKIIKGIFGVGLLVLLVVFTYRYFDSLLTNALLNDATINTNSVTMPIEKSLLRATSTETEEASVLENKLLTTHVTALKSVNLRADATKHSLDVGDLLNGQEVTILECKGGWARTPDGWINAKYLGGGVCTMSVVWTGDMRHFKGR